MNGWMDETNRPQKEGNGGSNRLEKARPRRRAGRTQPGDPLCVGDRPRADAPAQASYRLSHLDDDLALCTSFFDVRQRRVGRFEWKDPTHNRVYDPRSDQRTDLA